MLLQHYGRDFAVKCVENTDNIVPQRITSKLVVQTPSAELVDLYLHEIAKAYSINWQPGSLTNGKDSLGAPPSDIEVCFSRLSCLYRLFNVAYTTDPSK